jgi:hypothetical protein
MVRSEIGMREVKEQVKLDNLRLEHVTIRSELRYLIGAQVVRLKYRVFGVVNRPNCNGPGFWCGTTRCHGPVPGRNRTRNRTGNLDPLLTLPSVDGHF